MEQGIMRTDMTGMLAMSRAGRDKGNVYVIIREEAEYVYLADGKNRTVNRPKRKNKRHIQIIKKIKPREDCGDLEIKRTIRKYQEEANVKGRCN